MVLLMEDWRQTQFSMVSMLPVKLVKWAGTTSLNQLSPLSLLSLFLSFNASHDSVTHLSFCLDIYRYAICSYSCLPFLSRVSLSVSLSNATHVSSSHLTIYSRYSYP